jgi:ferredoxin
MSAASTRLDFENYLEQFDSAAWAATVNELLPSIHDVDKTATRIWFAFYPLDLVRALEESDDPAKLSRQLLLQGDFVLGNQIDTSHTFLYGHRFWPTVKKAVVEHAESGNFDAQLAAQIRAVAAKAASSAKKPEPLLVGITAAAFMTVAQAGLEAFKATPGAVAIDAKFAARSPEQVLRERAKDPGQGLLGFLRTIDKRYAVTFDENAPDATFTVFHNQDMATAGSKDPRDFKGKDPRCVEGPIPVECRTAACGTCWVGVLGGADRLTPVEARERMKMREFGYVESQESHPVIRLACVAKAHGPVSVVVPPWNGVYGQYLERRRQAKG